MSELISPSKINTYLDCPFRYKLLYIDRVKPLYRQAFDFGKKLHDVIREYYTLISQSKDDLTQNTIPIFISNAWKKVFGKVDENDIRFLNGFMKFESERLSWHINPRPIVIEKEFVREPFHGIVDALFMRGKEKIVVDWKTGLMGATMNDYIRVQGNIYMYLTDARQAIFVSVGYGSYTVVEYDETFLKEILRIYTENIRGNRFEPVLDEHCKTCEVSIHCYTSRWGLNWWDL